MRVTTRGCLLTLLALSTTTVLAQDYPARPIRIVVPTAAAGSPDVLARLLAERLRERWGQPVVIENRAGAGQIIGAEIVAKAPADGYTLLLPTGTYTTSVAIRTTLPFDPARDLTGVAMVGQGPLMLVVHPSLPARSMKELIALAKARPGDLNYATAGTGSIIHFAAEALAVAAGIDITHVPYKSATPAVTDLLLAKLSKRGLDTRFLEFGAKIEKIGGDKVRQPVAVRTGIDSDNAKKIQNLIKQSKLKVQAQIQGDVVRVSGGKRDDLQAAIRHLKAGVTDLPLSFTNFRD